MIYQYLLNLLVAAQYELPRVFDAGHRSTAVNGVLWALKLGFVCYFVVAVIGLLLRTPSTWGYLVFGLIAFTFALVPVASPVLAWSGPAGTTWLFFSIGALSRAPARSLNVRLAMGVIIVWVSIALRAPPRPSRRPGCDRGVKPSAARCPWRTLLPSDSHRVRFASI